MPFIYFRASKLARTSSVRFAFITLLALSAGACGGGGTKPLPAECSTQFIDPFRALGERLNLGNFFPVLSPPIDETVQFTVRVRNQPDVISADGNADLVGTISFAIDDTDSEGPFMELFPRDQNPNFRIRPPTVDFSSFEDYRIRLTVPAFSEPKTYSGYIDFGNSRCDRIRIDFQVLGRPEDPPRYERSWGLPGTAAGDFNDPLSLAWGPNDWLYVLDQGNDRVQFFDGNGVSLGGFSQWSEAPNTPLKHFENPRTVNLTPDGNVLVTDNLVFLFDDDGSFVESWASTQDGTIFNTPHDVIAIANDTGHPVPFDFVVVDTGHRLIRILRPVEIGLGWEIIREWGGLGEGPGQFLFPHGIARDSEGNFYVSDELRNDIQKFSAEGAFLMKWGSQGSSAGEFETPHGLTVDAENNVFVADTDNNRIQKFTSSGEFLTDWGRRGLAAGEMVEPEDVVVAPDGSIYIADTGNNRIQKFTYTSPAP